MAVAATNSETRARRNAFTTGMLPGGRADAVVAASAGCRREVLKWRAVVPIQCSNQ